jgi:hypothetical protein
MTAQLGVVAILVGFWGKEKGKGEIKTFNLNPVTFSPNPIPS